MKSMDKIVKLLLGALMIVSSAHGQAGLQSYTPSVLYDADEWELKVFHNHYRQQSSFGDNGLKRIQTGRGAEVYATTINQFLIGLGGRVNIGADVWVKSVNLTQSGARRTAVSGAGPKIKIAPIRSLDRLSYQMTFLFPVGNDLEGRAEDATFPGLFLEADRTLWLHQIFYDLSLGSKSQLFFQQALWVNLVRNSFRGSNYLQTQTSVFYNYFPDRRWTFYALTELFPTHYDDLADRSRAFGSFFIQSGAGAKYQLLPGRLELEALYTRFVAGSTGSGAGDTFNIGLRLIR